MRNGMRIGGSLTALLVAGSLGGSLGAAAQVRDAERLPASPFEAGYRSGIADERRQGSDRGPHWNDAVQAGPMERLELARILLREALVMLRRSPDGERRDRAIEQARQALVRTQNAMTWLPREDGRAGHAPRLEHGWGERASGGPEG